MNDLISKQGAIDALWKALYDYEDKTEKQFLESEELNTDDWFRHRIFVQNMSDIDRQTIINLPSAQQWISCSKRLPEEEKEVLVYTAAREMLVAYLFDDWGNLAWTTGGLGSGTVSVVAWMPLPEPYKEGENVDY